MIHKVNITKIRDLLVEQKEVTELEVINAVEKPIDKSIDFFYQCPECGAPMVIIEILAYGKKTRASPKMGLAS